MNSEIVEEWRPIAGWERHYQVSNLGRVRNVRRWSKRFNRVLKGSHAGHGYLVVNLNYEGRNERWYVHRLVATTFIPNPDNKPEVNHLKGIRTDNRASELEWATTAENILHACRVLGSRIGSKHHLAILTESDIQPIFDALTRGASQYEIAKTFGVSRGTIQKVVERRTWIHVRVCYPSK